MQDRVCVITGGTSGIGKACAAALAAKGARLVLVARNPEKAAATRDEIAAATGNAGIEIVRGDLASLAQIREAAKQIVEVHPRIDLLHNNAGVVNLGRETTVDGIETTFAVNHLACFLLTRLLLDALRAAGRSRIVHVASDAHRFGGAIDLDDPELEHGYSWTKAYGRSKGANILFTRELARRLGAPEEAGVTVNCLHPGFVRSSLGANNGLLGLAVVTVAGLFAQSPERGARSSVWLCTDPALHATTGGYFARCRPHAPAAWARDEDTARRLWELSADMTGVPPTL